jgi:hypothetical protein
VVTLDLPRGAPSLALRITTPVSLATTPTATTVGGRSSWHLATLVAVVRASDGLLVASRGLQSGSWGRRLGVTAAGTEVRHELVGPTAPFTHAGGTVPDHLAPGRYYLVAMGADGSPALPNPGWSVDVDLGVVAPCVATATRTTVVERDQTDFTGGTQVTGYGGGLGQGTAVSVPQRQRFFVGMADAQTQLAGSATMSAALPRARLVVTNGLRTFSAGPGTYRVSADWSGAFPLVLLAGVGFTPR